MCQSPAQSASRWVLSHASAQPQPGWQHLSGFGLLCNLLANEGPLTPGGDGPATPGPDPAVRSQGQVIHIGNYIVGDEECPLLFGVPGIRY